MRNLGESTQHAERFEALEHLSELEAEVVVAVVAVQVYLQVALANDAALTAHGVHWRRIPQQLRQSRIQSRHIDLCFDGVDLHDASILYCVDAVGGLAGVAVVGVEPDLPACA